MIYLMFAGMMLITLFLIILIELKRSIHLIYIIPATLSFFMGVYYFYDSVLGYPAKKVLTEEFRLLAYNIPQDESEIYIWVSIPNEDKPIAVIIPYSQEDHKSLQNSGKMMKDGKMVEGTMSDGEEGEGDSLQEGGENGMGTDKSKGGLLSLYEMTQYRFLERKTN